MGLNENLKKYEHGQVSPVDTGEKDEFGVSKGLTDMTPGEAEEATAGLRRVVVAGENRGRDPIKVGQQEAKDREQAINIELEKKLAAKKTAREAFEEDRGRE